VRTNSERKEGMARKQEGRKGGREEERKGRIYGGRVVHVVNEVKKVSNEG
jgi:hypothetical protein